MTFKRAHMVSKGYLRAWANDRSVVFVADAEARRAGVRNINNATVVSYAYKTELMNFDLEDDYARVEGAAIPAMRNLASGGSADSDGVEAIISFLDMHLERGRYADQANVKMPIAAADILTGGFRMTEMGLGDRIVLSRNSQLAQDVAKIRPLRIDRWRWRMVPVDSGLVTGDGAVLMWQTRNGAPVSTICFPLSPTRLLVVGNDLDGLTIPINDLIASKSRRWLVDHVSGTMARAISG